MRGLIGNYEINVYDKEKQPNTYFNKQKGKEYYCTKDFKDTILYEGCTENSYRKVSKKHERKTGQKDSCSSRTLQSMVTQQGVAINQVISEHTEIIKKEYKFKCEDGKTTIELPESFKDKKHTVPKKQVELAFAKIKSEAPEYIQKDLKVDKKDYELKEKTMNITVDDVCTKRQESKRETNKEARLARKKLSNQRVNGQKKQKERKYIYQNVIHIEQKKSSYLLSGEGFGKQLEPLIAFLLKNNGLAFNWVFFVDGQRTINTSIENRFAWRKTDMVLDWYHLQKKIHKQMFMSVVKCNKRDELLWKLLELLWYGLVDEAQKKLDEIDSSIVKNEKEKEVLKEYFERNRAYIKCYAMRKELGLRNSSNLVEQANNTIVSIRQKHQAMSWTEHGTTSLAIMTALKRNNELENWLTNGKLNFALTA